MQDGYVLKSQEVLMILYLESFDLAVRANFHRESSTVPHAELLFNEKYFWFASITEAASLHTVTFVVVYAGRFRSFFHRHVFLL